jgi:DNA polymerase-3 subunit epsilon
MSQAFAQPFAVLDVETTGLFPRQDRVLEIAIIRMAPDLTVLEEYTTLINPERDVGPTRIHRIRASDVTTAPRFPEIAGDVVERLAGSVVVGHNVRFDAGFVVNELERMGHPVPAFPRLCTIGMSHRLGLDLPGRKLAVCCEEAGIALEDAHTALGDAIATSKLLATYLTMAHRAGVADLETLGCDDPEPVSSAEWPRLAPSGRVRRRGDALAPPEPDRIAQLLGRLSPQPVCSSGLVAAYLELLERVLEDRVVTEEEAGSLHELASLYRMSREDARAAHRAYLRGLAEAAADDGRITPAEKDDLDLVTRLLGHTPRELDALIQEALTSRAMNPAPRRHVGTGIDCGTICFTGDSRYSTQGVPITRAVAEGLARSAGLTILRNVSRKLDLLVVADPATASSKSRRARELGTRVMVESEFWRRLGVRVE